MDYSICKALSYNMDNIPVALVMYDIMCQYGIHFKERVNNSPELSLSGSLELRTGIGLFHIHGHQDSCLPRFSPSYIPGAKQVDGEIIETLWAPLNNVSRSIRGMSLNHRQEVLDAHMNHSNWKKLVRIGKLYPFHNCIWG
jgi:Kyakuja-Dileera-Zisupton transposase